MKIETIGRKAVEEAPYGVYVWKCPDGEYLGDGDNLMMIFSMKGDRTKIKELADAARYYGFPEGEAVFWAGKRPITDEEYEEQLARQKLGLVPDPYDFGALRDEAMGRKYNG